MKQKLINLYNLVFFKNPKRPYLLWWQAVLVYLQWVATFLLITNLIQIDYSGNFKEKKIIAMLLAMTLIPLVMMYLRNYQIKIRFLMNKGTPTYGRITSITNISSLTDYIIRNKSFKYKYSYTCPRGIEWHRSISENKLINKYHPHLKVEDYIKILYWEKNTKIFIWDFETTYFNINKNYKKCEK